jgi:hypothetical protein
LGTLQEYKSNPEFLALRDEILSTQRRLDDLMVSLRASFPLDGMRVWSVNGRGDRLCLTALTVSIPESEN